MKIIGLLFGLYLGSIMSVQAQDLSKDATSIITDSRTEVLCKSMTQSIEKESRTILILNRKGLNAAYFVCECDMFRSLQKFSGEILNASGQSVRKIKKSELQKSEYSSSLSTDDYAYYYECNFPSFPFTVKYEWEIKCNNGLIGYQSFLPQTDFQQGVEQATYRIELPAGQECRYRELNTGGKNIQVTKSTGTDGQQVIEVTASKLLPVQKEPFGPDFAKLFPRIYFAPSAFKYDKSEGNMSTWQKYGEWQYKLLDGRDELTEPFRNKLHGLTAHCSTDREKVKAIYDYLAKTTRYVSIQLGIAFTKSIHLQVRNGKVQHQVVGIIGILHGSSGGYYNHAVYLLRDIAARYYHLVQCYRLFFQDNVSHLHSALGSPDDNLFADVTDIRES